MGKTSQFQVKHLGNNYNIYEFLNNHPGGINYVQPYKEKEVTKRMKDSRHSKAAYYLLREYKSEGRDESNVDGEDLEVCHKMLFD